MTTTCLCMIVRDEAHVIERCLRSVVNAGIDYWVIADTGSRDLTPKIIETYMASVGIPGELWYDDWRDFSHNRNLVMDRAMGRADWLVWIDADGTFEGTLRDLPAPSETDADAYAIHLTLNGVLSTMLRIFRGTCPRRFEGKLHEHVDVKGLNLEFYPSLKDVSYPDGARSKNPTKWLDDAAVLETMPRTYRTLVHLAHSYREAGAFEDARAAYIEAAAEEAEPEQVWIAKYYAARVGGALGLDVERELLECFNERPKRAEPLYELARLYRSQERWGLALMVSSFGMSLSEPRHECFSVDTKAYRWGLRSEFVVAAGQLGATRAAREVLELMLSGELPDNVREHCEENLRRAKGHNDGDV